MDDFIGRDGAGDRPISLGESHGIRAWKAEKSHSEAFMQTHTWRRIGKLLIVVAFTQFSGHLLQSQERPSEDPDAGIPADLSGYQTMEFVCFECEDSVGEGGYGTGA